MVNDSERRKIRVGLVGCGGISHAHMKAYQELADRFEVAALCDIVEEKARGRAEEFGVRQVTRNYDELLAMDVDVIDIVTPPYLHAQMAKAALEAGKTAFCEKPLAGSMADVDALAEAEKRTGRRVMPIFNYRFGSALQRLKHLQEQGIPGKLILATIETHWYRPQGYFSVRWRSGWRTALGGSFIGHAIHAHDALTYIAGPVKSVFARAKTLSVDIEVEDTVAASLEMADGALAVLSVTFGSAVEISRHRYVFQNMTAESNTSPYASHTADPWTFQGVTPEVDEAIAAAMAGFTPQPPEGFVGQFKRFADAWDAGAPLRLPITLEDGRRAVELVTAVYYSARTGQNVELPLRKDHPWYAGFIPENAESVESLTDYARHMEASGWKPKDV